MKGFRRRAGAAVALAVLATACAGLGPGSPECVDGDIDEVAGVMVLQLQAVIDAELGMCIEELKVGWEYEPQEAQLGEAKFWLSSDRMGDRFAEVKLTTACDTTGAIAAPSPRPGITRYVNVESQPGPIQVALIPVAPRHAAYASRVLAMLEGVTLEGRGLMPFVPVSNASPAVQIERALANGQIVFVVDDREEASGTVELRRSGQSPQVGIDVEDALEEIEEDVGTARYEAEWYHLFPGGCITYRVDAKGAGAETIAADLDEVLGFYPLAELRELGRESGVDF
jgi:hypothetical protein